MKPDNSLNKPDPMAEDDRSPEYQEWIDNNFPEQPAEDELWLERAKKLMEWNEDRYGDPTILEYLRHYKNGTIKERHIEAAISTYTTNKIIERLEEIKKVGLEFDKDFDSTVAYNCLINRIAELKALNHRKDE